MNYGSFGLQIVKLLLSSVKKIETNEVGPRYNYNFCTYGMEWEQTSSSKLMESM